MEDDQQFCLRWNNHQSTLIQNFDTLLESGTLVDCTLAAEGKYLKAHKVVLSACSPYFEGLLSEHYDKHPVFILKDVKFKELKAMMDYMYRGEVNISQDQLAALLKAAESLQIKGLSESKTSGSSKTESRLAKVAPQPVVPPLDISYASSGLTIEKNKVPRQGMAQGSVGDLPEDSASPQVPKGLSSREGSQSPTSRKRKRFRRRSVGEDNSVENHEASNSSDMPQQMGVPALGIAPVADEKTHADPTDSLGRSALMTQLTKPADEMLQLPLEKPEPNDSLIEPKSEYLEDPEESVEDLTLDDDMNDLNEMEQDNNRAGPSHDPSQHPAGLGAWHVTGDRGNAGGVVGSVAGAPGTTDEVFLAAQEAAQAHRDSQDGNINEHSFMSASTIKSEHNSDATVITVNMSTSSDSDSVDLAFTTISKTGTDSTATAAKKITTRSDVPSVTSSTTTKSKTGTDSTATAARNTTSSDSDNDESWLTTKSKTGTDATVNAAKKITTRSDVASAASSTTSRSKSARNSTVNAIRKIMRSSSVSIMLSSTTKSKPTVDTENNAAGSSNIGDTASTSAPSSKEDKPNPKRDAPSSNSDTSDGGWSNFDQADRPQFFFPCDFCNRKFSGRHLLAKHVKYSCVKNEKALCNNVAKDMQYVCGACEKRFRLKKMLTFHQKHECNVKVTCPYCHANFAGRLSLKHINRCRQKMFAAKNSNKNTNDDDIFSISDSD